MRVFACMASTLDGKIGPAGVDHFVAIGSRYDMENLISLRDEADGILFGASTFRAWPKVHSGTNPQRKVRHFIMSRSLELNFSTPLFQDKETPVTIFHGSHQPSQSNLPPPHVEVVSVPEGPEQVTLILKHVARRGIKSLLIEGGGQIIHQFVEARTLEELYLTLVPSIIGDREAPSLLGNQPLTFSPQIKILNHEQVGNESFLHLRFVYP